MTAVERPEERSLFDHVAFLLERWPYLVAIPLVFATAAYAAGSLLLKSAEGEGILQIGTVQTVGFIEPPAAVVARVQSMPFLWSLVREHGAELTYDVRAFRLDAAQFGDTGLVRLAVTAPDEPSAAALIRLVGEKVASQHASRFDRAQASLQEKIAQIAGQVKSLQELSAAPPALDGADPTARAIAEFRRSQVAEQIGKLEDKRIELALAADRVMVRTTALVEGPATRVPSRGRKAGLLGLASGLAVAVFMVYLLDHRRLRAAAG